MANLLRVGKVNPSKTLLFVCDMQQRFTTAIYQWKQIEAMSMKMLKAAELLNIPTFATEQNPKALGSTVPSLASHPYAIPIHPKTKFSMMTDEIRSHLASHPSKYDTIAILGIESHVCVLQTALDFLQEDYQVHILADAVSSCNAGERPIAFQRLRDAGAHITTTESFIFQLLQDATNESFKPVAKLIKDTKEETADALKALAY